MTISSVACERVSSVIVFRERAGLSFQSDSNRGRRGEMGKRRMAVRPACGPVPGFSYFLVPSRLRILYPPYAEDTVRKILGILREMGGEKVRCSRSDSLGVTLWVGETYLVVVILDPVHEPSAIHTSVDGTRLILEGEAGSDEIVRSIDPPVLSSRIQSRSLTGKGITSCPAKKQTLSR